LNKLEVDGEGQLYRWINAKSRNHCPTMNVLLLIPKSITGAQHMRLAKFAKLVTKKC
jgi:hypothetical protein